MLKPAFLAWLSTRTWFLVAGAGALPLLLVAGVLGGALPASLGLALALALGVGLAASLGRALSLLRTVESTLSASLSERTATRLALRQHEVGAAQLKRLLIAQHHINQICLEESDAQLLLDRSARALTEHAGYVGASVVLLSSDGSRATHVGHARSTRALEALSLQLKAGSLPGCFRAALQVDHAFVRPTPRAHCRDCPMANEHADQRVLCHGLTAGGKTLGVVLALPPKDQPAHPEEPVLFGTIAGDIAFGLSSLETKGALHRAATIIERSPVSAFTWAATPGWPVTYATANVLRLFGYSESDFLEGRIAYEKVVHPDDLLRVSHEMDRASADPAVTSICHEPYRILRADGSVRWVLDLTSIQRDSSGAPTAFEGIIMDVTDRQKAELALVAAKRQAEVASQAKSAFLAAMSHELRTPLNAILGFTHLLRREAPLPPEQVEHLDLINRSGEHLLHIINDVLDLSKVEAGGLTIELSLVDVVDRIRDIVTLMRPKATERGLILEVSCDCPSPVRTDATKFRQVVFNLIGNAIKFTQQGRVALRIRLLPTGEDARHILEVEVEDTGIGIATEDLPRLCEPFFQASHHAPQQGTGLGLAITRQYLEKLGGTLDITSTAGLGSCFRAAIPVDVPTQASTRASGLAGAHPGLNTRMIENETADALALLPDSTKALLREALLTLDAARINAASRTLRRTHPEAADDFTRQAMLLRYTSLLHRLRPAAPPSARPERPGS